MSILGIAKRLTNSRTKLAMNETEQEQPYTFVVTINDSYCTYEYTFKHTEEVSIHDLAKEIAQKLKCEVPEGTFIK